ncbi:BnaUnng01140D [Brassica napus]|uniref:BnaUnng01140D protein n=1 Tax=Brassica napus TaxID=3708 RepID=A0A078JG60_BRANA|nr:BnaUnng01140D [Brassica napus]
MVEQKRSYRFRDLTRIMGFDKSHGGSS